MTLVNKLGKINSSLNVSDFSLVAFDCIAQSSSAVNALFPFLSQFSLRLSGNNSCQFAHLKYVKTSSVTNLRLSQSPFPGFDF